MGFKSSKASSQAGFALGELVWGKFTGYPWWPGQVISLQQVSDLQTRKELAESRGKQLGKKEGCLVHFFGDDNNAWMVASKIQRFAAHYKDNCSPSKQTSEFKKGLQHALALHKAAS